jgi:hypothetical protein
MGRVRVFRITEDFDSPFTNGKRPKRKVMVTRHFDTDLIRQGR